MEWSSCDKICHSKEDSDRLKCRATKNFLAPFSTRHLFLPSDSCMHFADTQTPGIPSPQPLSLNCALAVMYVDGWPAAAAEWRKHATEFSPSSCSDLCPFSSFASLSLCHYFIAVERMNSLMHPLGEHPTLDPAQALGWLSSLVLGVRWSSLTYVQIQS